MRPRAGPELARSVKSNESINSSCRLLYVVHKQPSITTTHCILICVCTQNLGCVHIPMCSDPFHAVQALQATTLPTDPKPRGGVTVHVALQTSPNIHVTPKTRPYHSSAGYEALEQSGKSRRVFIGVADKKQVLRIRNSFKLLLP